jgi:xanthine dehydrogenase YagR molybdenum-binding subunit
VAAGLPAENIDVRTPFLDGGFGSKGLSAGRQILGILATRLFRRP